MAREAAMGKELVEALAGLLGMSAEDVSWNVRRVVLDIKVGHLIKVYVERVADRDPVIEVLGAMTDVHIIQSSELSTVDNEGGG